MGVIVAEEMRDPFLVRRCLSDVSDKAGWGPFVVGLRRVGILNQIVRHIRPQFSSFSGSLHSLEHLARIDEATHRYTVLLPVHFYTSHSYTSISLYASTNIYIN